MKTMNISALAVVGMVLCTLALMPAAAQLADTPWPTQYQNNNRTGLSPYVGPLEEPIVKWTLSQPAFSPSIGPDGTLYAASYNTTDYSWRLFAMNSNGTVEWSVSPYGRSFTHTSIDSSGIIYAAGEGGLHAIYPNGTIKWAVSPGRSDRTLHAPAIGSDGMIYVTMQNGYAVMQAYYPNGTKKWQLGADNEYYLQSWQPPALGPDDTIYSCGHASTVPIIRAIDPNGTEKWDFTLSGDLFWGFITQAIGSDGTIYSVALDADWTSSTLYALNLDSGTEKWNITLEGSLAWSTLDIGPEGTIYVGALTPDWIDGTLYAINPNGTEKWTNTDVGQVYQTAIDADGTIYVGDMVTDENWENYNGTLYAINPDDGTEKWTYALPYGKGFTDQNWGGDSLAIDADGTIYAMVQDPNADEYELWAFGAPPVPNATVYFEPEDIRLPGYCNTTTVGVWVNTTIAMGSGQLKFNYTYCCANVTEFESNSTNFDAVANPGSLCAAVLTPGQVKINFATTAPAGLGPGPVHIGNLTIHCCNETGYCMTDLTWLPGYPDSYVESAANGFIEPVKYEDGEFRCNIPDLVITGVYGLGNDTHYTVNYTVKNEGAANAAAGHYTNLTVDGVQKETKQVPDVLAPGEEREYSFDTVLARNTSNPYDTIQVCADYDDTVVELSETNNCKGGRYPAEVVISVVPEVTVVQPQEQFDVKIHVDPRGQFIYGVQYYLKYNTSVLRAETQVKGPFLGSISDTMVVINNIDQVNGIVEYAETRKVDGGVNVPDNVSTIHFIAIGERGATSTLDLFDVVIVDENKEETLYKTNNGTVEINENQPPVPIAVSKHRTNNVAKKYQSTAILCSCSYDPDYPGKGGNVSYIRWAFGDGQYGTSEGLPVDNCTCKEHKYESWLWNYTSNDYDNFSALLTVTDDGCPELSKSSEFDVTVFIAGDADGDGEVNIIDAVWVGKHWREECATTVPCANCTVYLWDGAQVDGADLNNDCEINILDAVVIGANWRHVAW